MKFFGMMLSLLFLVITVNEASDDVYFQEFLKRNLQKYRLEKGQKLLVITNETGLSFRSLKGKVLKRSGVVPRLEEVEIIDPEPKIYYFNDCCEDIFIKVRYKGQIGYVYPGFLFLSQDIDEKTPEGTVFSKTNNVNLRSKDDVYKVLGKTKGIFDRFKLTGEYQNIDLPKGAFLFAELESDQMIASLYIRKLLGVYRNPYDSMLYLLEVDKIAPGEIPNLENHPLYKDLIKKYQESVKHTEPRTSSVTPLEKIKKRNMDKMAYKDFMPVDFFNLYYLDSKFDLIRLDQFSLGKFQLGMNRDKIYNRLYYDIMNSTDWSQLSGDEKKQRQLIDYRFYDTVDKLLILSYLKSRGRPTYLFLDRFLKQSLLLGGVFYGSMWLADGPLKGLVDNIKDFEPKNVKVGSSATDFKNYITDNPNTIFIGIYVLHTIRCYFNTYGLTHDKMDYINREYLNNDTIAPWEKPYVVWNDGRLVPVDEDFIDSPEKMIDSLLAPLPEKASHPVIKNLFLTTWNESIDRRYHPYFPQYAAYLYQQTLISFYRSFYGPNYKKKDNNIKKWYKGSVNFFNHRIEESEIENYFTFDSFQNWRTRFFLFKDN